MEVVEVEVVDVEVVDVVVLDCDCCGMWLLWNVVVVECGCCGMWLLWNVGCRCEAVVVVGCVVPGCGGTITMELAVWSQTCCGL